MPLRTARAAVVVLALWVGATVAPSVAAAQGPPMPPASSAWILVDADTGAIIAANGDRTPVPPASTIKLLTALIAVQRIPAGEGVPISAVAEGIPARKINVKAGQVWTRDDLLHSMITVSANDAAVALAERVGGGSLDGWVRVAQATARRLGLRDDPFLADPSGLDDEFSHDGGSRISARDLAIVARAALFELEVAETSRTPEYRFTGGDNIPHHVTNHNQFLRLYPGAVGLKTGTTDLAGRCLVAAATRDGRTMLAVILGAPDTYGSAARLLDTGFATPASAQSSLEHLPDVVPNAAVSPPAATLDEIGQLSSADGSTSSPRSTWDSPMVALVTFVVGVIPLFAVRRRLVQRLATAATPLD